MGKNLPIALRYHGGKSKIADWVISHFPKHDIYVEPFGGGASILLKIHDSEDTLFYLDPPYIMDSRKCKNRLYKHEMTDEDHRDLAAVIKHLKGKVIISGYASELYSELYADFRRESKTSQANSLRGGVPTVEVLWLSKNIREQSLF